MRVLVLVDCYLPSPKAGGKLIHDLAVELRCQGHQVTVLTPSDSISGDMELTVEDNVRVVRVKTGRIKGSLRPLRAIREVCLSTILWRRSKQFLIANPADVILFYSPTIFFSGLVRRLKLMRGCPAYLILRDIFPQWAVDASILRKGLVWRYLRKKEREQYEAADRIAVQSPANLEYFAREFSSNSYSLEVLYNWMSLQEKDLPSTNYRTQLGLQGKVVFFYGGNLGVAQDVENIIRLAARLAEHKNVHFLLVGEGSEVPRLRKILMAGSMRNIQILPALGQRAYLSVASEFDVGLISLDRRLKTHNVPGKMLGYMYSCKPTLASINAGNDLFEILGKNQAGFCLLNGDDDGLCAAALRLANDPDLRCRMGKNARTLLARLFSVEAAVTQIINHFQTQEAFAGEVAIGQPAVSLPTARKS